MKTVEQINQMQSAGLELQQKNLHYRQKLSQGSVIQSDQMRRFGKPHLIARLQELAAQAEAESDSIAANYMSGTIPESDFLLQFLECRKLFHLRQAKIDTLRSQAD